MADLEISYPAAIDVDDHVVDLTVLLLVRTVDFAPANFACRPERRGEDSRDDVPSNQEVRRSLSCAGLLTGFLLFATL